MHQNTMEVEIHKIKSELNTMRYQYNSLEDQVVVIKEMAVKQRVEIQNLRKELELANNELAALRSNV